MIYEDLINGKKLIAITVCPLLQNKQLKRDLVEDTQEEALQRSPKGQVCGSYKPRDHVKHIEQLIALFSTHLLHKAKHPERCVPKPRYVQTQKALPQEH